MASILDSELQPKASAAIFIFGVLIIPILGLACWHTIGSFLGKEGLWPRPKKPVANVRIAVFVLFFIGWFLLWSFLRLISSWNFWLGLNIGTFLLFLFLLAVVFIFSRIYDLENLPECKTLKQVFWKVWSEKEGRWIIFAFVPIVSLFFFFECFGLPGSGGPSK
jgi:hypothetical protein